MPTENSLSGQEDDNNDSDNDDDDLIIENSNQGFSSNSKSAKKNFYKANSDIYPTSRKNVLANENHDLKVDLNELKLINKHNIKPIDNSIEDSNNSFSQMIERINQAKKDENSSLKITQGGLKVVQVSSYDLNKTSRRMMDDRKSARRLEISEMLAETLVTSALIAGSTDNITVNCILLPGCHL